MSPLHPSLRFQLVRTIAKRSDGFTLIELLIVVAVGGFLLLGVVLFAVSSVRTTARQMVAQRYQMGFSRLSHLLETEVSESQTLLYGQPIAAICGNQLSLFTLTVPVLPTRLQPQEELPRAATIHYYQASGNVWRCGPIVNANGTLNPDITTPALLLRNSELNLQATADNEFQYRVIMRDQRDPNVVFDSSASPGWLTARTRVFQVGTF